MISSDRIIDDDTLRGLKVVSKKGKFDFTGDSEKFMPCLNLLDQGVM